MGPATYQFITRPIPSSSRDNNQLEKVLKRFHAYFSAPSISLLENLSLLKILPRSRVLFIRQIKEIYAVLDDDVLMLSQIILCHEAFPYSCRKEYLLSVHHWLEGEVEEVYLNFVLKGEIQSPSWKEAIFLLKKWDEQLKKKNRLQGFMEAYPQILSNIKTNTKDVLLFSNGDFIISQGDLSFKNRLKEQVEKKIKATPISNNKKKSTKGNNDKLTIHGRTLNRQQSLAVISSLSNSLTLITGGPGTGKTTAIAAIIDQFVSQFSPFKKKIALVAPTGKAANRMLEGLSLIKDLSTIEMQISTLHQILGLSRHRATPRVNETKPMNYDLVILDESSMVNLKLMVWLMEALLPHSKLILIGDTNQLPAIDGSAPFHEIVSWVKGQRQIHIHLTQFHRFTSQMGDLVKAMEEGQIDELFLTTPGHIKLMSPQSSATARELIKAFRNKAEIKAATTPLSLTNLSANAKELEQIFKQLSNFVFLTSGKIGFWGSDFLNQVFSEVLGKGATYYEGQPIMILENNYPANLFNGDRGVILRDNRTDGANSESGLFALFRGITAEEPYRIFSLGQLPKYETSYAMTIHKSQGSEFKEVVLCFTEIGRLNLSKELLYTGITRSKEKLTIIANKEVLIKAARKTIIPNG